MDKSQSTLKSSIFAWGPEKLKNHLFVNGRSQVAPSSYPPCTWWPGRLPHCASSSLLSPVLPTEMVFWWMCKKTFVILYLFGKPSNIFIDCQFCVDKDAWSLEIIFNFFATKPFTENETKSGLLWYYCPLYLNFCEDFCTWTVFVPERTFVRIFVPELLWGKPPQQADHSLHSFSPDGKYE